MDISLTELEQAINYWRKLRPATGEEHALSPEVDRLATIYALMIHERQKMVPPAWLDDAACKLIDAWKARRET